jgi:hypothetical protein
VESEFIVSPCIFLQGLFYDEKMFYTYILYSESIDQYYTGHTSVGVEKRLTKHNKGGNLSTKAGIPWKNFLCLSGLAVLRLNIDLDALLHKG